MDSLFCRSNPLHVSSPSPDSDPPPKPRSFKICACRPTIKPSPPAEDAIVPSTLRPLPFPSARSTVPGPLRPLFFKGGAPETRSLEPSLVALEDVNLTSVRYGDAEAQDPLTADAGEVDRSLGVKLDMEASKTVDTRRTWFPRLSDLLAILHNIRILRRENVTMPPGSAQVQSASTSSVSKQSDGLPSQKPEDEDQHIGCCDASASGEHCSLEVPYTRTLHNRESFSKFLQDASLSEAKELAQMSFLCEMAYMIPDIQPGLLLKHHDLQFVTSSLDRKSGAVSKEKGADPGKSHKTGKMGVDGESNKMESTYGLAEDHSQLKSESNSNGWSSDVVGSTLSSMERVGTCQDDMEKTESYSSVQDFIEKNRPNDEESLLAVAGATTVVVAEEETKHAVTESLNSSGRCPSEWFVCDDPNVHTRVFVIQGSESLASWQANLLFEPTKFEELDVLVHRGIYEAANALYEEVLPLVLAHVGTHDNLAQVRFTGHSLGGSLAILLALMFQLRGVLPRTSILPVVTFGSPSIMCGGDRLLRKMKLPLSHIKSIVMHRDVVPRAFSCDYPDRVAEVLKRLNGRFRNHPCLKNQKLLYAPMGQMFILQPNANASPSHPFLPDGDGLYILRHPTNEADMESATELRSAQRAFLNMPHPLEILIDPGAYGSDGTISRDHDTRSYRRTIDDVVIHEVRRLRRVQRKQRRQFLWPSVIAKSSLLDGRGQSFSSATDRNFEHLAHAVNSTSPSFPRGPSFYTINQFGFTLCGSIWKTHKNTLRRYARIIASQHVQIGILSTVSLKMVFIEYLSALLI